MEATTQIDSSTSGKRSSPEIKTGRMIGSELEQMEAGRITGLPERTARNVLNQLVQEGFLLSDTPKGKVRVGFPMHALGSLLPNLYPAGDMDLVR